MKFIPVTKKVYLLQLLFFISFLAIGQELPPIQNFTRSEYQAETQNWDISQGEDGIMYFANNSGLLEYNGAHWQLYYSPNNTILRSVEYINGKVYTGAYMEFGYWTRDNIGMLRYTSMSDKIEEKLLEEDFWNIIELDDYLLFQSLSRIYIYNTLDDTFDIIETETSLPKMFIFENQIFFQKIGEGIFKIENGQEILVANGPAVKNNIIANIFRSNESFIIQTQEAGAYIFKDGKTTKWNVPANEVLSKNSIYSSIQLKDRSLVVGTISDGIYHISETGEILLHMNQRNGLLNNTALSLFQDKDNNVWIGQDNGISVLNLYAPFVVYNDSYGEIGSVYASAIHEGKLYLGSNQGLFYREVGSQNQFEFIEGTKGQVWCLEIMDNQLLCGHNNGTFLVNGSEVKKISDIMGTWTIRRFPNFDNLLIQGQYAGGGLTVLEKVNNEWKFKHRISGYDISSRSLEFITQNTIVVNHEYKGVLKVHLNSDFTEVVNFEKIESAPISLKSDIAMFNNSLYYFSQSGFYKFDMDADKFVYDSITENLIAPFDSYESGNLIVKLENNSLWGFTKKNIFTFSPGNMSSELKLEKIAIPADKRLFLSSYENLTFLDNQHLLFGTTKGYFMIDREHLNEYDFNVSLDLVENHALDKEYHFISQSEKSVFRANQNNFSFFYSVPEYNALEEVYYQYKLTGLSNNWSDWSTIASVNFENLRHGKYSFEVRARKGNNLSKNIAKYDFEIDRPWYISNEFMVIYFVFFLIILFAIHMSNKRYYKNQKIKQLKKQEQEFTLTQLENEQQIMKLRNDKLRNEIESKTRELSTSTMSVVKKNELLNEIKGELESVSKNEKITKVLKIIDKNLSEGSDWKMFEKAFNDADSDFLKKIKTLHPNLTPSDLKLCAYLRLNLSSKEIAPLLHISSRSVEIKRYRLRKKMDLSHEKSLVEYILEI